MKEVRWLKRRRYGKVRRRVNSIRRRGSSKRGGEVA
jgi:hypothetical protein